MEESNSFSCTLVDCLRISMPCFLTHGDPKVGNGKVSHGDAYSPFAPSHEKLLGIG